MSIASQLIALEGNISDSYNMVAQRGGTVPARKNMENLKDAIATIPSYSPSVFPLPSSTVVNGKVVGVSLSTYQLPPYITDVGNSFFSNAGMKWFWNDPTISSGTSITLFDFSSLTTVSGGRAFEYAFSYLSFDVYDTDITFDFSSLTTISGTYAFSGAWSSWSNYNNLNCVVIFSSLTTVTGSFAFDYAFSYNECIQSISFPVLSNLGNNTSQFNGMLNGCSGVTVHFPAALQSVIGSWTSVQNGFGGTNTTVLFDL